MKIDDMVKLMSRTDKIRFLLKSNLFDINKLTELTETELNDLVIAGLEATGFKFKEAV